MTRSRNPSGERDSGSLDPAYYEALGRAIQVLRVERGLARKELAERSGVSYPYLSEIENGKKRPSSESLLAIANALEIRPSELMERAEGLRGTAPAEPHNPPFEGMAPTHEWAEPVTAEPPHLPSLPYSEPRSPERTRMLAEEADRADQGPRQSWFRTASAASAPAAPKPRRASLRSSRPSPSPSGPDPLSELIELARRLAPDDVERLLDLARRLGR